MRHIYLMQYVYEMVVISPRTERTQSLYQVIDHDLHPNQNESITDTHVSEFTIGPTTQPW